MPRFSELLQGTRARRTEDLPLSNGETVKVDLRILTPIETATVLEKARAFAIDRGVKEPEDGQPIYDLGLEVETLALACIDHESPTDKPERWFKDAKEILESELLTRDTIAWLFARYEWFVEEMSLQKREFDEEQFTALVKSSIEGDMVPFWKLGRGLQVSCFRTLARRYGSLLKAKFLASRNSESVGSPPTQESESATSQ